MKQLIILSFIFLSVTTFGQNAKQAKKISIGYTFSPDYSYRTLKNADGNSTTDLIIKLRNDIEKPKFGYTTGFNFIFPTSSALKQECTTQIKVIKPKSRN